MVSKAANPNVVAVFEYLCGKPGFEPLDAGSESARYVRRALPHRGTIDYGWEFQLFSEDGWSDPTEPGFYLWSGLGDRESYGLFIPCSDIAKAQQLLCGLSAFLDVRVSGG